MAREIESRLWLRGKLVAKSPIHVGGLGDDVDSDLPLAVNGAGDFYVPGTSLAGSIRQYVEERFGDDLAHCLWGYQTKEDGKASHVVVEDGVLLNPDEVPPEIRDGVGIDRQWGAAAEHIKYDRAVLPKGTRIDFAMYVEVPDGDQRSEALAMLAEIRRALQEGLIRLGAGKTRGLGYVELVDSQITEQSYKHRNDLWDSLISRFGSVVPEEEIQKAHNSNSGEDRPRLEITVDWEPVGPLMVKAGADGIASDMLPLVSGDNGKVSLVLPGSSIKGALREHAERVVRTVKLDTAPDWLRETDPKKRFLSAVEMELIDELFGKRGQKDKDQEDHGEKDKDRESNDSDSESWRPGLGALSVRDCYATQKLSRQQWQAIEAASDDVQLQQALRQAGLGQWSQAYHVAVDRWLGSAAEAMLYTVLEPHAVQWEPICLEVNLARLPKDKQLAAVALLLVVLRDLARGFLPLGFATHRGMGAVRVSQMTIAGHALGGEWNGFQQAQIPGDKLSALPSNVLALLEDAWRK